MDCRSPGSSVHGKEQKEKITERSQVPAQEPFTKTEKGVKGGEKKGSEQTQMEELVENAEVKTTGWILWCQLSGQATRMIWGGLLEGVAGPMCLRQGVCGGDRPSRELVSHVGRVGLCRWQGSQNIQFEGREHFFTEFCNARVICVSSPP